MSQDLHVCLGDVVPLDRPVRDACFEHVFRGVAVDVDDGCFVTSANRHDIQIEIRNEAAVEAQLLLAEVAPELQRAEVQKSQIHRFFQLVGVVAGQKDPRNVRFHQADVPGVGCE